MSKSKKSGGTAAKAAPKKKAAKAPKAVEPKVEAPQPEAPQEPVAAVAEAPPTNARKADEPLTCLDAAAQVLTARGEPMRAKDIIDAVFAQKLWHSDAPTPAATLVSAILREMKKGEASRFAKAGRGPFALNTK